MKRFLVCSLLMLSPLVASGQMTMAVDTALTEVPVNIFPLTDSTDFVSIEGAVAYNASGMALRWHFVSTSGAYTVTSVTPTTGGSYDWTDQGDSGIYTIEIPASGGASANNDTEGYGWFTGVATGVLAWRGPVITFAPANIPNSLVNGSDYLLTDATPTPEIAVEPDSLLMALGMSEDNLDEQLQALATFNQIVSGLNEVNTDLTALIDALPTASENNDAITITAAKIAADAIGSSEIAADAIGASEIASSAIASGTEATGFGTAQTGDSYARLGAPAGASIAADIAGIEGGGGSGTVTADRVPRQLTWFLGSEGNTARNIVTVNAWSSGTRDFAIDFSELLDQSETTLADLDSVTVIQRDGSPTITTSALREHQNGKIGIFTCAAISAANAGTYDVVATIETVDSNTIVIEAVLEVE